jgi:predicted permease
MNLCTLETRCKLATIFAHNVWQRRCQERNWSARATGHREQRICGEGEPEDGIKMKLELFRYDLRQAVNWLVRRRRFTILAVLTIALGIGPCAAVFTVVNAVVLRQLPFGRPDELVSLWMRPPEGGRHRLALPDAMDLIDRCRTFSGLAYYMEGTFEVSYEGYTEELATINPSLNIFEVLGVTPTLGRGFNEGDDNPDGESITLISHDLWQRWYDADPRVLGKILTIRGVPSTIVGVLPEGFGIMPTIDSRAARFHVWTPFEPRVIPRRLGFLHLVGRLRDGSEIESARNDVEAVARQLEDEYPETNRNRRFSIVPFKEQILGPLSLGLMFSFGAVGFVVLIAVSNVTNLLLAESVARRREIVLKMAVGATGQRIMRGLLFESLILSGVGGAFGLLVATVGTRLLIAIAPPEIPRLEEIAVNGRVVLFCLAVSILTGVVLNFSSAAEYVRVKLSSTLDIRGGVDEARYGGRKAEVIVVAQVALAVVLLVGAGLMTKSFGNLLSVDPGFQADRVLAIRMRVPVPDDRAPEPAQQMKLRIEALPEVERFGMVGYLPFAHAGYKPSYSADSDGPSRAATGDGHDAFFQQVTPGYFEAMGIQLLEGRLFTHVDLDDGVSRAIVSRSVANECWPGQSAVGRQVIPGHLTESPPFEVIGVVSDTHQRSLETPPDPTVYIAGVRRGWFTTYGVVRTSGEPERFARLVGEVLRDVDEGIKVLEVTPLQDLVGTSLARPRFIRCLLVVVSFLSVALASVGVYGVMDCSAASQSREVGVRLSIGATSRDILWLYLRRALQIAMAGMCFGALSSFVLTRFMKSLLFEVTTTDPPSFFAAGFLMLTATMLACLPPALRALRVDPVAALRDV